MRARRKLVLGSFYAVLAKDAKSVLLTSGKFFLLRTILDFWQGSEYASERVASRWNDVYFVFDFMLALLNPENIWRV